jgi:hypothetical protein
MAIGFQDLLVTFMGAVCTRHRTKTKKNPHTQAQIIWAQNPHEKGAHDG